jgi:hypothetical protein
LFRAKKSSADLGRLRINIDYFAPVLRASMSLLSKKGDA